MCLNKKGYKLAMIDKKKTTRGNIFDTKPVFSAGSRVKKSAINFKETWGREAPKQPGFMLEVFDIGHVPFKKIGS